MGNRAVHDHESRFIGEISDVTVTPPEPKPVWVVHEKVTVYVHDEFSEYEKLRLDLGYWQYDQEDLAIAKCAELVRVNEISPTVQSTYRLVALNPAVLL